MTAVDILLYPQHKRHGEEIIDYNEFRRKRTRFAATQQNNNNNNDDDNDNDESPTLLPSTTVNDRQLKRKRLEEIADASRSQIETEIIENINVELEHIKRRKRLTAPKKQQQNKCHRCAEKSATYDEEAVRHMISVALETQKQKLVETFIEEHLDFIEQQTQSNMSLQPKDSDFSYVS